MKIALVVPGFSRDADDWAIPALQNLALLLAQMHDVHVFSLRYPERGRYYFGRLTHQAMGGGVNFGLKSLPIWWETIRAIVAEHRRQPFDVIHAFWLDEPAFTATLAGRLVKRPVLASIGGGELVYFPDIHYGTQGSLARRLIIRFSLSQAGLITAGSNHQIEMGRAHGAPAGKLRLAPFGVNTAHFRPGTIAAWRQPTLIQAASLVAVKNQALLLEVLQAVKKAVPAVRLILAGSGPLEENLRHQAQMSGLGNSILWREKVAHPCLPGVYRGAHLYLQTSRHESQGVAVLEAMACGLPALGTPVGLMPEVACRPPAQDKATLAAQVIEMFSDYTGYKAQRLRARRVAEERYSLPVTMARFLQLYEEAGQSGQRGA
jgi:glycosyltransferase involved in cell wall biosynthesis